MRPLSYSVAINHVATLLALDHELCHPLMTSHNIINHVATLQAFDGGASQYSSGASALLNAGVKVITPNASGGASRTSTGSSRQHGYAPPPLKRLRRTVPLDAAAINGIAVAIDMVLADADTVLTAKPDDTPGGGAGDDGPGNRTARAPTSPAIGRTKGRKNSLPYRREDVDTTIRLDATTRPTSPDTEKVAEATEPVETFTCMCTVLVFG